MKLYRNFFLVELFLLCLTNFKFVSSITLEQFEQSLDMMRSGCAPKFKVTQEQLDGLRDGKVFDESNNDLKCYMKCIAQLAGTLTKKGELNVSKAVAQIPIILPAELQDMAKAALNACKDVQKDYKDSCDKMFYITRCVRDFSPENFKFP